jgi:chromosome segregation ATPase
VLVLRARDCLSRIEAVPDPNADSFWSDFEQVVQHHEKRMKILAEQATVLEANIAERQRAGSSRHVARMSESRTELFQLKDEINSVSAEVERRRPSRQQEDIRSQILHTDRHLREMTRTVTRLRQSSAELKVRLQQLISNADSGLEAMKRRKRDDEARLGAVVAEIETTERQINRLDDELDELEIREAACKLLLKTLSPSKVR